MYYRLESGPGITSAQEQWLSVIQRLPEGTPHPRDYIHGAVFLFREPKETAALSYDLSAILVCNGALVTKDVARTIWAALHEVIPQARR